MRAGAGHGTGGPAKVTVVLRPDGSATLDGRLVHVPEGEEARGFLMSEVCDTAERLGRPVPVTAHDPLGTWYLLAHPDGRVTRVDNPADATPDGAPELPDELPGGPPDDRLGPPGGSAGRIPAENPAEITTRRTWYRPPEPLSLRREPEAVAAPRADRRRPGPRVLAATVGVLAGVAVLGAAAWWAVSGPRRSPDGAAGPGPSGPLTSSAAPGTRARGPTDLTPVGLHSPPGFATRPVWTAAVSPRAQPVVTDDGTILARSWDDHVVLIDSDRGTVRWSSDELVGDAIDGPRLTTVDGNPTVAVATSTQLALWTLPESTAGPSVPGHTPARIVALPGGATVSYTGPEPLVHRPDGAVAVVRQGALVPLTLPAGARALAADAQGVLAASASGWQRVAPAPGGGPPSVETHPLPRPSGTSGDPVRLEAVGTGLILAFWASSDGSHQVMALRELVEDRWVLRDDMAAGVDVRGSTVVRQHGGTSAVVGPLLVDVDTAWLRPVAEAGQVRTVARGHVYGLRDGRAVDLRYGQRQGVTAVPFAGGADALPVGLVSRSGTPRLALLLGRSAGGTALLVALPAT